MPTFDEIKGAWLRFGPFCEMLAKMTKTKADDLFVAGINALMNDPQFEEAAKALFAKASKP